MEQLSSTATPKNQINTSGGETLESKEMQQIEASELQTESAKQSRTASPEGNRAGVTS